MIKVKQFMNVKVVRSLYGHGFCQKRTCHKTQLPRVCVIGSGPAGFYTAQRLLKFHPAVSVDIYERLPVPFGLVRFGAAPDHAGIKNVTCNFTRLVHSGRCHFIGNVALGTDVSLSQLKPFYNAIVLAYGVQDDKQLGIPGEALSGIYSARSFVGWYNGMPEHQMLNPNLSGQTAVIIGQGNVAVDVARILLTPVEILQKTDICDHALEALSKSNIQKVYLVGRAGPLQATLTSKELRELGRVPGCQPQLCKEDFTPIKSFIDVLPRARKRLTQLMMKIADEKVAAEWGEKQWGLTFFRKPVKFNGNSCSGQRDISSVTMEVNKNEEIGSQKVIGTGTYEIIKCSMVIRSIGFKCLPVDESVPFDTRLGVIPNIRGRVTTGESNSEIIPGLYCSGWVKRGPYGNTPVTMLDGFETADRLLEDLEEGLYCSGWVKRGPYGNTPVTMLDGFETADRLLEDLEEGRLPRRLYSENVLDFLHSLPVKPTSFSDWERIDRVEVERGRAKGKPREKVVSLKEMMEIIEMKG